MKIQVNSKERSKKVLENEGLVYHLLKRVNVAPSDYDDLVQEGMIGLIKAVDTFDETRKVKFGTYASTCINNEIMMYFRRNNRHIGNLSLNETIREGSAGEELTLESSIADPSASEFTEKIENIEIIERALSIILNCLSHREKIVLLFLMGGVTQRSIGKRFGLSQGYVSRFQSKLYKRVREYVSVEEKIEEELFRVSVEKDMLRICISTISVESLKEAFANFLLKTNKNEGMQNFKIACENGEAVMYLLAVPESFNVIAEILLEVEKLGVEIEK